MFYIKRKKKFFCRIESTGFIELEENISEFLTRERGKIKLSKFIECGIRISRELRKNSIEISYRTLGLGLNELEQKINKLKPEAEKVKFNCDNSINGLRTTLMNIGIELQRELDSEHIAKAVEKVVAPLQTELQYKINNKQTKLINAGVEKVNKRLGYELNLINDSMFNELAVEQSDSPMSLAKLHEEADEDAIITGAFGIATIFVASSITIFALPIAFFGRKLIFSFFKNRYREKVVAEAKEQVDKRYRGIIPDLIKSFEKQWKDNTNETIKNLKLELDRKSSALQQQLNSILEER